MFYKASQYTIWCIWPPPLQQSTKSTRYLRISYGDLIEIRKRKTPLVTWTRLTQPREYGGLGFKEYVAHAWDALLSRWVAKSMEDTQSEWLVSFWGIMGDFTWEQRRSQNRARYNELDQIVLKTVKLYGAMQYTMGLWKAWMGFPT